MPRIRTHKATAKRIRVSGGKKRLYISRHATQGHFNAREDGSTVRLKRKDIAVDKSNVKRLKILLPYSQKKSNKNN